MDLGSEHIHAIETRYYESEIASVESDPATWSEADYQRLLAEFESLFNTLPGAAGEARYDALADLIEAYEYATEPWIREELAVIEAEKARRQAGQGERKLVAV